MDPNVQQSVPSQSVGQISQQVTKSSSLSKISLSLIGVFIILGLIGGAYYLGMSVSKNSAIVKKELPNTSQPSPTPVTSSFLETFPYDIPFSATQADWENYLSMNLLVGSTIQIPQTDFQLTIPATFESSINTKDANLNATPELTFIRPEPKIIYDIQQCRVLENVTPHNVQPYITQDYCKPLLTKFGKYFEDVQPGISEGDKFAIYVINSDLSPQSWIKETIKPQGSTISDSSIQTIQTNGFTFYTVQAGCCTEYDLVYVLSYVNAQGQKILLIFNTNNPGGSSDSQKSTILDEVLSTSMKKS